MHIILPLVLFLETHFMSGRTFFSFERVILYASANISLVQANNALDFYNLLQNI